MNAWPAKREENVDRFKVSLRKVPTEGPLNSVKTPLCLDALEHYSVDKDNIVFPVLLKDTSEPSSGQTTLI
jgi:hypothetical protein